MEEETFIAYHRQNARKEDNIIYHFRIATHGKVKLENTHPFIISEDWQEIGQSPATTTKNVLAHNGIITTLSDDHDKSDSKTLAHLIADPDINNYLFNSNGIQKLIQAIIETDKLVIMNKKGKFILLGDFEKSKGVYYSNFTFRYKRQTYISYYNDWEDYSIATPQTDKQIEEAKLLAEENYNCCKVKNARCAYCNTEKGVYYYWDIEENLCKECYHRIYEED